MKPNRPDVEYNLEKFVRTLERIPFFSYRSICMTPLQIGSVENAQPVFMQHNWQNQCYPTSNQIKKINKSYQVNNAVR